ncbi:MAG: ComEC/Rec2 family competence protein, partial [Clostridia bacterium]|nr:ComEC/Rec2 family competence protein [Clostridia bacterium]
MKKFINYRPLFFCFLAFAAGIGFANFIFAPNYLVISIIIISILGLATVCFFHKHWKRFFCLLFVFIIGVGAFFIDANNFSPTKFDGNEAFVVGRIGSKVSEYDNFAYLILENVEIDGKNEHNINVCISGLTEFEKIKTGNHITFIADIYNEFLFENNKFNYYSYMNNAPYFCYIAYEDIFIIDGEMILSEKVKDYIKNLYGDYMSVNGAQFAYNMLFGEKSELNPDIKENFGISGISHLLAVSGLNINFLVAILYLFLNKFKLGKYKNFLIIAIILFLYAYMCNFSASVVRAAFMCLVFLSSGLFGRPYDLLNSIAISGILILAFAPLMIFDVGFQMSFICVFAIAFFVKPFTAFFIKLKIPKQLSVALAIDISTTIAIFPLLSLYFGRLSILTTFANLICVPLFGFSFVLIVIVTLFASIFNFLGFFLLLPDLALKVMISIANFVAGIDNLILSLVYMNIIWLILFYSSLFILSCFVLVKFIDKVIMINGIAIICVTLALIFNMPYVPNNYTYTQLNSNDSCAVMTTANGEVLVIGGIKNPDYLIDYLNYKHIC